MNRKDDQVELRPFLEALEGLRKNGFQGVAKIQTIEWPLAKSNTLEIVLELKKEILPAW
jgi:hypothetical protein